MVDKLIQKINELYGLQVHSSEKVTKGFLSENHIIYQNDAKYFLKRYRFDNKERIEEIHSAEKYFADGGIPAILPVFNKEGETFFCFEEAYFAVFPFISDKQLDRGLLTDTAVKSLGETLGKIHLLGKRAKLAIKERFKPWNKKNAIEKIEAIHLEIKKKSNLGDFDILALESIQAKKRLIQSNLTTYEDLNLPSDHLIHGDYLDHNVFFGADDKVSFVFDFEKTDYSPRMYELFRSLAYAFLSNSVADDDIKRAKLYLNSYLAVYPAPADELARGLKLFFLKSIHGLWVEGEHYLKNNDRTDEFLPNDFQRIKYLSENFKDFENKLF